MVDRVHAASPCDCGKDRVRITLVGPSMLGIRMCRMSPSLYVRLLKSVCVCVCVCVYVCMCVCVFVLPEISRSQILL